MKWRDKQGTARRLALLGGIVGVSFAVFGSGEEAHAQAIAGTTQLPLPNVMLLIDSSGSMERMSDNTLPKDNHAFTVDPMQQKSQCIPGTASQPNRWGMLVQALTGNLQPYFSCDAIDRTTPSFKNEFRIGGGVTNLPYDADYYLPYHRPLSGLDNPSACAFAPSALPGASGGNGLGPAGLGVGGDAADFPSTAFVPLHETYIRSQYGTGAGGSPVNASSANTCVYDQAVDGQLDAARDYVRFGLMTFDNDPDPGIGVTTPVPPGGNTFPGPTPSPFLGQWSYIKSASNPNPLGFGIPANCATTPIPAFEVGARHWAAPPWEGRMIRFPSPAGTLFDIETTNDQIQQVLMGMRPYGATPIDGMMEDARDYLWYNDYGPNGTQSTTRDPYVQAGGCRPQYIILLTDGAPNLDLRPTCENAGAPHGICPYPNKAAQVADLMAQASGSQYVQTYVIGFSVNNGDPSRTALFPNDGFPPTYTSCKGWFNSVTSNGTNLSAMHNVCGTTPPIAGSTADACCRLSEIAYYGSKAHNVPPFFAESQADLVLSFGRVLGGITRAATTRTVPGYSPPVTISGNSVAADFIASFVPNAEKVWSGEIDRTRTICTGAVPTVQAEAVAAGDSYAANLASQASNRRFVSVQAADGTTIDSLRTIRPWATGLDGISPGVTGGSQVVEPSDLGLAGSSTWADALQVDDTTCKRSRANDGTTIPALTKLDCLKVIWGFATGTQQNISAGGYTKFNVRCDGAGSSGNAAAGQCSVTGGACTVLTGGCPSGEVCVPKCSELGAIFRSSPQLVGPPTDLDRDDNYRAFADQRKTRRPAMFVQTTDGVLHAFKALASNWGGAVPPFDSNLSQTELWSFVPPAVLPRLASNYPGGQQILLDGTPNIKDIIWDRTLRPQTPLYHSTLVSGLGQAGGGYYGLSVTDWDCQGAVSTSITTNPSACLNGAITNAPNISTLAQNTTQGPQFLWQLTDIQSLGGPTETLKASHTSKDGKVFVPLFGKQTGNPVLATVSANPDTQGVRDIGIAILPGGIDGTPIANPAGCPRAINHGSVTAFLASTFDQSDNVSPYGPRGSVRQWAAPDCNAPVPGRNVTIVRADTGEIIRVFGRPSDIPQRLASVVNPAPFDSPIIGTPAVYPSGVGVNAQKIFVGDADGTVWRIDVSNSNPSLWQAVLFQDLVSLNLPGGPDATKSEPIQIPLELTQDPYGGIVVTAATGDQENIVASANETNYLFSIQEQPAAGGIPGRARVRWYQGFPAGARVTGPMTIFDRALFFASYAPVVPTAGSCNVSGNATLWGMDYFNGNGGNSATNGVALNPGTGGAAAWCPIGSVDSGTGACAVGATSQSQPAVMVDPALAGAIIPGVTVRASPSCATFVGGANPAITGISTTTYSLFFGATASGGSTTGSPQALRPGTQGVARPLPRTPASIDSWAFVVD